MGIYKELGVRRVINGEGTKTHLGGSIPDVRVMDAMKEASQSFVIMMELIEKMWDFWGENGKNRERIGEMIQRIGLGNFLEEIEVEPIPEMIVHPRTNPYIFFEEYYEDDDEDDEN